MKRFEYIESKLEGFIKKFYLNKLIKGTILFISIGTLYFILSVAIEHLFYLPKRSKTFLFGLFVAVELFLFIFFIIVPIVKLFRLSKGISTMDAAKIIGDYFPDVDDRLVNLMQLSNSGQQSDLLLASIDQKSEALSPIPFKNAINFKSNFKYLRFVALPIALFLIFSMFSGLDWFTNSYDRFVRYDTSFTPPAPFSFFIINDDLVVHENKDFLLQVKVLGTSLPEMIRIHFDDESYFMTKKSIDTYEYVFKKPSESKEFYIEANGVRSTEKILNLINVPNLIELEAFLNYPNYTNLKNERLFNTGNFVVPEGTTIQWKIKAQNTEKISFLSKDSLYVFLKDANNFSYDTTVFNSYDYTLFTSNRNIENYDRLDYSIKVTKDEFPKIVVQQHIDTLKMFSRYYYGKVSDDYAVTKLQLVYQKSDKSSPKEYKYIDIEKGNFSEFVYEFPGELELEMGENYEYYFEVSDNDRLHNFKKSSSQIFMYKRLSLDEMEEERLKNQQSIVENLDKSLDKLEKSEEELKQLSRLQKEQKSMDYEDKRKLKEFLQNQKKQEQMMKKFAEKLENNLSKEKPSKEEEPFKDALKEKLERQQERLKKNEELLKEIEKLSEQLNREKLTEKLDELSKDNKSIKKNLEQLLELTKRFYVKERHDKIAEDLFKLGDKQEELSKMDNEKNTAKAQDSLSKKFDEIKKALDNLQRDNQNLKKPMGLDFDKKEEEHISKEQEKAKENIEKGEQNNASKNQKMAAQKMKNMAAKMQNQMQMSGEAQQQEDTEMLRQILDNLVDFSLSQENLLSEFSEISINNPVYSSKLKRQSVLRENFIHIDDSLYALALRTSQITDDVLDKLGDVEFNLDKSIERLAENQLLQGRSSQQFTITGANDLAYLLSNSLEQMQNSIPSSSSGKGQGQGFQLPDIIKSQEQLNERMQKGSQGKKKGKGGESTTSDGENGEQKKDGNKGKQSSGKQGEGDKKQGQSEGSNKGDDGKKGKKGNQGNNTDSNGEGSFGDEDMNGELFEIYKAQQQLRQALEEKINASGIKGQGKNVLMKMEGVENELLQRGFNEQTLQRMMDIKHQLLKLDKAAFEQGKKEERESTTNFKNYNSGNSSNTDQIKQYFKTTEILDRQVLPLRKNYKERVKTYFNTAND
ncbi:DUF4175 family protein [Aquimarina sp. W85]|uniref:DUF4175 family protein n=1 Tax=Aquimarina rhodophyticola TaxID=3342246 RepID=UPI003672C02E